MWHGAICYCIVTLSVWMQTHKLTNPLNPLHNCQLIRNKSVVSLKRLGDKLTPKLIYFVLRKELLNFHEMAL